MSQPKTITRPIASHTVRMNPGSHKHWAVGGSIYLVLGECGHEQGRKKSQGLPKTRRVRCRECESLRDGGHPMQGNGDGSWTRFGWDAATGLPTRTRVEK